MSAFKLKAKFKPAGSQPKAIKELIRGLKKGFRHQTLLGITGSGKTFTLANVIAEVNRPTLVIGPNKTLVAQLCNEFREFFPEDAVEYFVSYYDYYQPEAYLPHSDTYIEKDAKINQEVDKLRHSAVQAVLTRRDVIVCATVSCIYGIGSPEEYEKSAIHLKVGNIIERDQFLLDLINSYYRRTNTDLSPGSFRARGNVIEIMPADKEVIFHLELESENLSQITEIDPVTRKVKEKKKGLSIFAAKLFVTPKERFDQALLAIEEELSQRLGYFRERGRFLEAERLERRTLYDLDMLREIG